MEWYKVKIYFPAENGLPASTHYDEIQGNSQEDALQQACWNWDQAKYIELIDTELIQKALIKAGYDVEPTEENLRECFGDYADCGVWSNIELEDVKEITITEMCKELLSLR